MRWWLQTSPPYLMSVDNASTRGMDYTDLLATEPDIYMVQWSDGRGEIERLKINADNTVENLNGLREAFIDVIPYAPYFQQFLRLMQAKALLLPQAKKVDVDLIRQIFESKRQAPFHYPVAAGDYWWDATDESLMSSTVGAIQNATASLNTVIARLNSLVASINAIDAAIVSGVNGTVVAGVNANMATINSGISSIGNNLIGAVNTLSGEIQGAFAAEIDHINNVILGTYGGGATGPNTVNNRLANTTPGSGVTILALDADIAHFGGVIVNYIAPGTFNNVTGVGTIASGPIPWTNIPAVSVANAQWIPIGATAPVTVTPAEQAGILNGITARTNALNVKKNIKIGEVNALTDLQDVIDYDVTAGW